MIGSAMNYRMMLECGYEPHEISHKPGFSKEEVEKEIQVMQEKIVEGWKMGHKIAFIDVGHPEKRNWKSYFIESTGKMNDREWLNAAMKILEVSLEEWKDSGLDLAWIKEESKDKPAAIEFPLRPDLK